MLYFAVVLLLVWILWSLATLVCKVCKNNYKLCKHKAYQKYSMLLWWIVGIVSMIMTLNCFLLYQVPTVAERFELIEGDGKENAYEKEQLAILRDYVVEQANKLSEQMARDEQGYILTDVDLEQTAREEMKRLGEQFPNLKGYYPKPKSF